MKVSFGPEMCRDFAHREMLNFGGSKKPATKKNDQPKKSLVPFCWERFSHPKLPFNFLQHCGDRNFIFLHVCLVRVLFYGCDPIGKTHHYEFSPPRFFWREYGCPFFFQAPWPSKSQVNHWFQELCWSFNEGFTM